MALVPVITSPCPLRFASMPSVGRDFCGQCKRRVHNLDGMSDAQRVAFFANCSGEVCVTYSVRRSNAFAGVLGLGMAAAALVNSMPAAADTDAQSTSAVQPVVTGPTCDPNAKSQALDTIILAGGTTRADKVQWVDESEAADNARPVIGEVSTAEWLPTPHDAK
jgi:hypothetical protein